MEGIFMCAFSDQRQAVVNTVMNFGFARFEVL